MISHGPMIAELTDTRAQLWLRTVDPSNCRLDVIQLNPLTNNVGLSFPTGEDNTISLSVDNLLPSSEYVLNLFAEDQPLYSAPITTFPALGSPDTLRFVFVSDCFREYAAPALAQITALAPHGMFIIGDWDHKNYLANTSTAAGALGKARAAHRELRGGETDFGCSFLQYILNGNIPILGHIADDHDNGADNRNKNGKWWPQVQQAMQEYWPASLDNGFGFDYQYSAVRLGRSIFALIDTRTHRDVPGANKPLFGDTQKLWLTGLVNEVLTDDRIDRLFLVLPVPFNPNQHKLDSCYGYPAERQWLLDTVAPLLPSQVMVVSGDCHWGSFVTQPKSPLIELNIPKIQTGGFANTCNHNATQWTVTSTAPGGGFGMLTVTPTSVTMTIYNVDGSVRFTVEV